MNPLVSIIIPTIPSRNKSLQETIQSINKQTYTPIETIIVNEKLPANIQRNIGIKRSKGEYLYFLDDDDLYIKDKIQIQIQYMEKHNVNVSTTYWIDERFNKIRLVKTPKYFSYNYVLHEGYRGTGALMFRRTVVDAIIERYGFFFDPEFEGADEYDLMLRVTKQYNCDTIPKIGYIARCVDKNFTVHKIKKVKSLMKLLQTYGNEFPFKKSLMYIPLMILYLLSPTFVIRFESFKGKCDFTVIKEVLKT